MSAALPPLPPACQCATHHLDPRVWRSLGGSLLDVWGEHALPPASCTARASLPEAAAKICARLEAT